MRSCFVLVPGAGVAAQDKGLGRASPIIYDEREPVL